MKKFTAQQSLYAKELITIAAHESTKIHKLQDDGMRRYNVAFGGFSEAMSELSKMQENISAKVCVVACLFCFALVCVELYCVYCVVS